MSSLLSLLPVSPTSHRPCLPAFSSPRPRPRICTLTCCANSKSRKSPPNLDSGFVNALLKLAWYGSELLGIAASSFRTRPQSDAAPIAEQLDVAGDDGMGAIDRGLVVETIKKDFERSYFVTGNLTLTAYENNCEFADPAGSFKGLQRFKRNCTNFGSLLDKSDMKLTKWEDFEGLPNYKSGEVIKVQPFHKSATLIIINHDRLPLQDKGIGHWRFICVMSFPWKPILSATGYTEYYFDDESGRVCRHVEHWNVPKIALLKQIFTPGPRAWWRKADS